MIIFFRVIDATKVCKFFENRVILKKGKSALVKGGIGVKLD